MPHEVELRFYKGRSPIAWAVRWQTRSQYSHVAIVLSGWQIEAIERRGVVRTPLELVPWKASYHSYYFWLPAQKRNELEAWLKLQVGKPYDWPAVARFLTRRRGVEDRRWFCSELIYAALKHVGLDLLARTEAWEVSPGLLSRSPYLHAKEFFE